MEKMSRWSRQSSRTVRTQRSANALAFGDRTGLPELVGMRAPRKWGMNWESGREGAKVVLLRDAVTWDYSTGVGSS